MTNKRYTVRYYLNPETGRVIKSNSKKFQELMSRRGYKNKPIKHSCLFNIKSAERCLNRLLTKYPGIIHPPSSFAKIPKTYQIGHYRGFIMDDNSETVIGAVDKYGKMSRLKVPVKPSHKVPVIKDPFGVTQSVLQDRPVLSSDEQHKVEEQLNNDTPLKSPEHISLIYNPVYNDIIPMNTKVDVDTQKQVINSMNKDLVPLTLPPVLQDSNIAGLVTKKDSVLGIVDTNNQIKLFPETDVRNGNTQTKPLILQVEGVPKVDIHDSSDILDSKQMTSDETKSIMDIITCLDGEQYDTNAKRCLPCSHYDLEWEAEAKMCKVKIRKPVVMVADSDAIVGYM